MICFQILKRWNFDVQLQGERIAFGKGDQNFLLALSSVQDSNNGYVVTSKVGIDFDAMARDVTGWLPKHSNPFADLCTLESVVNERKTGVKVAWSENNLSLVTFEAGFLSRNADIERNLYFAIDSLCNEMDAALDSYSGVMQKIIYERVRKKCQQCDGTEELHVKGHGCGRFRPSGSSSAFYLQP